jgi:hypothetical protein
LFARCSSCVALVASRTPYCSQPAARTTLHTIKYRSIAYLLWRIEGVEFFYSSATHATRSAAFSITLDAVIKNFAPRFCADWPFFDMAKAAGFGSRPNKKAPNKIAPQGNRHAGLSNFNPFYF